MVTRVWNARGDKIEMETLGAHEQANLECLVTSQANERPCLRQKVSSDLGLEQGAGPWPPYKSHDKKRGGKGESQSLALPLLSLLTGQWLALDKQVLIILGGLWPQVQKP